MTPALPSYKTIVGISLFDSNQAFMIQCLKLAIIEQDLISLSFAANKKPPQ
jgi:hypothetical protein